MFLKEMLKPRFPLSHSKKYKFICFVDIRATGCKKRNKISYSIIPVTMF